MGVWIIILEWSVEVNNYNIAIIERYIIVAIYTHFVVTRRLGLSGPVGECKALVGAWHTVAVSTRGDAPLAKLSLSDPSTLFWQNGT